MNPRSTQIVLINFNLTGNVQRENFLKVTSFGFCLAFFFGQRFMSNNLIIVIPVATVHKNVSL